MVSVRKVGTVSKSYGMHIDAKQVLASKPRYLRSPTSYAAGDLASDGNSTIQNVSMVARGEALGHDVWLDNQFLAQVYQAANAEEKGVKSRFTHPSMSGDGFGTFVGRVVNPKLAGDKVIGDLRFARAASKSPGKGDLPAYISQLAAEDPASFGMSIVFASDEQAERDFFIQYGGQIIEDPMAGEVWDNSTFRSPDPLNTKNLPHARLADLQAVDFVDEPAANPDGLFHREQNLLSEANNLAAYALGLANSKPELVQLDSLNAERVRGFVTRFLSTHKLEVRPMADEAKIEIDMTPVDDAVASDELQAVESDLITEVVGEPAGGEVVVEAGELVTASADRTEALRFQKAFGDQGLTYWASGKSMEEAYATHTTSMQTKIESLTQELASAQKAIKLLSGEKSPITFEAADKTPPGGFVSKIRMSR